MTSIMDEKEPDGIASEVKVDESHQVSKSFITQEKDAQTEANLEESEISVALPAGDWESLGPSRPEPLEGERESWTSDIDFLMTCISMSVGLGNIYRFPYVAFSNGGGAFLIPYVIVLFVVGRPMYYFELLLGQFSSLGCIQAWEIVPAFKGIGYVMVLASSCTVTFYTSVLATALFYFIASFMKPLPWANCQPELYLRNGKERDDVHCDQTMSLNATIYLQIPENSFKIHCDKPEDDSTCYELKFEEVINVTAGNGSNAEMFFRYHVVQAYPNVNDGIGTPEWKMTLCLLASWAFIFMVQVKGATGSGKVAWFTAMFPYVLLFTLFGMSVSLPNAIDGIKYFFTPQWSKLLDLNVWFQAVQQCFFSLGMGFGPVVVFGSFNDFRHNLTRDVWIVSFMDTFTSVLAGATIFAILGNLADGRDISKVVTSGPNIAFISYPAVLTNFGPYPVPQMFSVLFFFMLITLGIGSALSYTTTIISVICDQFPKFRRLQVAAAVCSCGFLLGLIYVTPGGPFMLLLVDTFGTSFVLYIVVLMEVIAVAWCYGLRNFTNDMEFMLMKNINWYWKSCWGFIIPVGLSAVLVYTFATYNEPKIGNQGYPFHILLIGKCLSATILGVIPAVSIYVILTRKTRSCYKKFRASLYPSIAYCPKDPDFREAWLRYKQTVPFRYHPWRLFFRKRAAKDKNKKQHRDSVDSRQLLALSAVCTQAADADSRGPDGERRGSMLGLEQIRKISLKAGEFRKNSLMARPSPRRLKL